MPERLTHQALPALSCFVDLLGSSHGPPWGSLLRELPLFLSAALGEQQALQWPWARPRHSPVVQWLEDLGALPESCPMPQVLPSLGGHPENLPVKQ